METKNILARNLRIRARVVQQAGHSLPRNHIVRVVLSPQRALSINKTHEKWGCAGDNLKKVRKQIARANVIMAEIETAPGTAVSTCYPKQKPFSGTINTPKE
jgi:phosphoribosylaminoimidazole carboxylase (NCAIR synthetase)